MNTCFWHRQISMNDFSDYSQHFKLILQDLKKFANHERSSVKKWKMRNSQIDSDESDIWNVFVVRHTTESHQEKQWITQDQNLLTLLSRKQLKSVQFCISHTQIPYDTIRETSTMRLSSNRRRQYFSSILTVRQRDPRTKKSYTSRI